MLTKRIQLSAAARNSLPAVEMVECAVRVSPALARRIRKAAELESSGSSVRASLLSAADTPVDRLESLEQRVVALGSDNADLRQQAKADEASIRTLREAVTAMETEKGRLRSELKSGKRALDTARGQLIAAEDREAALDAIVESLRAELSASISLRDLEDGRARLLSRLAQELRSGAGVKTSLIRLAEACPPDAPPDSAEPEPRRATTLAWLGRLLKRLRGEATRLIA